MCLLSLLRCFNTVGSWVNVTNKVEVTTLQHQLCGVPLSLNEKCRVLQSYKDEKYRIDYWDLKMSVSTSWVIEILAQTHIGASLAVAPQELTQSA